MENSSSSPVRSNAFFFTLHIVLIFAFIFAFLFTFDIITVIPALTPLFSSLFPVIPGGNLLVLFLLFPANLFFGIVALIFGVIGKRKLDDNPNESRYVSWVLRIGIYSLAIAVLLFIFFGILAVGLSGVRD